MFRIVTAVADGVGNTMFKSRAISTMKNFRTKRYFSSIMSTSLLAAVQLTRCREKQSEIATYRCQRDKAPVILCRRVEDAQLIHGREGRVENAAHPTSCRRGRLHDIVFARAKVVSEERQT